MIRAATALLVAASMGLLTLAPVREAGARPGGGQTFKSSSKPSSGGSKPSSGGSKPSSGSSYKPSSNSGSGSSYKPSSNSGSGSSTRPSSNSGSGSGYSGPSTGAGVIYGSGSSSRSTDDNDAPGGSSDGGGGGHCLFFATLIVLAIAALIYWLHERSSSARPDWSSYTPPSVDDDKKLSIAESFQKLVELDPGFSRVLFEDFLYALFTEVHRARGANQLDRMTAYLDPGALQEYQKYPASEVRDIIVGALSFETVSLPSSPDLPVVVTVNFMANYTEVSPSGPQSWYVEESWVLTRKLSTPSRKPEQARTIGCPNCGAPLDRVFQGACGYCNARVTGEQELDWRVRRVTIANREARGPMLTGTVEEVGNDFPTIFDPRLNQMQTRFYSKDPSFDWGAFEARVRMIFATFHQAWSSQDLASMRPFLSDNLFYLQIYWIDAYKKQGLRNVSESPQLHRVELCKIETDGHYDLFTVRMYAQNVDYTLDARGAVVAGDRSKVRFYTEYWTFLRGKEAKGAARADQSCPNCGAPLDRINMAGNCGSCGVKVAAGTFDWVLSRIEQDDVYTG
jgi:uncharacterized Zn finger protein (UPF0148 family)